MSSQLPANAAALLERQFHRQFGNTAPPPTPPMKPRNAYEAPEFLRDVGYGQHFIFDSQPHTLYVRARFGFGDFTGGQIAVVAIAATTEAGQTQIGLISEYMPLQTVRLVELVAPLQVRAL